MRTHAPYIIIAILFFIVFPHILIMWKIEKRLRSSLWWLIRNKGKRLPFSMTDEYGMGEGLVYCPHPFTNWSLNPSYRNRFNEIEHTIEGFRKTAEENSIRAMLKNDMGSYKIVCIGGSTTYCYGTDRYQDSWPALLKEELTRKNISVFNFGVPHWTTIQTFIRCMTWLPIVQPDIIIFYQAKNDLNSLSNAMDSEKYIFPDYQNVMKQFSEILSQKFPKWFLLIPLFYLLEILRFKKLDFCYLYKSAPDLKRIDKFINDDIVNGILFRTEALFKMSKTVNCKVLYIPEIVRGGEYAAILYKQIYNRIPALIEKYDNAHLFDIKNLMRDRDEYFIDKMHFNKNGNRVFAGILGEEINKILNL